MSKPARGEQAHAEIELAARRMAAREGKPPAAEPKPLSEDELDLLLLFGSGSEGAVSLSCTTHARLFAQARRCLAWERRYRELAERSYRRATKEADADGS